MFAAILFACLAGNTWYVDVNASAPGNGTQASPYTSIQYAIDQATTTHGDQLSVAPGVYVENIVLTKRVVVEAPGGPLVTILRAATPGTVVYVTANYGPSSQYAGMIGFTIDGTGNVAGIGARASLDSSGLGLERCIVTGFTSGLGVYANASADVGMLQCTVAGNQNGVRSDTIVHGGWFSIAGCIVRNNVVDAVNGGISSGYGVSKSCVPPELVGNTGSNFTGAPGFWGSSDFHLKPLSPCIDKAVGLGLPLDPDGSQPDTGALTFDPGYAPTATTYCTPKTNSLGCSPFVSWTGNANITGPDNFMLAASPALNNKAGMFLWGRAPIATPFAGGTLCINMHKRGQPLNTGGNPTGSDCSGVFSWHFSQAYMALKGVTAGEVIYAQAWGRDQGFAPPNNVQLSNAIVFPVGP